MKKIKIGYVIFWVSSGSESFVETHGQKKLKIIYMDKMYLEKNIWNIIKSYIFHDIKIHGRHLINDIYTKNFNLAMSELKRTFVDIYYCMVQYNQINILKNINIYEIAKGKYIVVTHYSILRK